MLISFGNRAMTTLPSAGTGFRPVSFEEGPSPSDFFSLHAMKHKERNAARASRERLKLDFIYLDVSPPGATFNPLFAGRARRDVAHISSTPALVHGRFPSPQPSP